MAYPKTPVFEKRRNSPILAINKGSTSGKDYLKYLLIERFKDNFMDGRKMRRAILRKNASLQKSMHNTTSPREKTPEPKNEELSQFIET